MSNKFYTKDGYLTQYALACGYIETNLNYSNADFNIRVYMQLDGSVYHVKGYDHNKHISLGWECYESVKEARKAFNALCREINDKRKFNI